MHQPLVKCVWSWNVVNVPIISFQTSKLKRWLSMQPHLRQPPFPIAVSLPVLHTHPHAPMPMVQESLPSTSEHQTGGMFLIVQILILRSWMCVFGRHPSSPDHGHEASVIMTVLWVCAPPMYNATYQLKSATVHTTHCVLRMGTRRVRPVRCKCLNNLTNKFKCWCIALLMQHSCDYHCTLFFKNCMCRCCFKDYCRSATTAWSVVSRACISFIMDHVARSDNGTINVVTILSIVAIIRLFTFAC